MHQQMLTKQNQLQAEQHVLLHLEIIFLRRWKTECVAVHVD